MRYMTEVTIDLPRRRVVALMIDPDNAPRWVDGLVMIRPVAGCPGEAGAVSDMISETKTGKTMTIVETVERNALPAEYTAVYDARGVWNRHVSLFSEDGPDRTLYVTDTEFKFQGFRKVIMPFLRKAFERETLRQMLAFKAFAENA